MKFLLPILVGLSIAATQMLAGGRSLALSLPGYGLLALAALVSWWPGRRTPVGSGVASCLAAGALFFAYIAGRAVFSPEQYLARQDLFMALGAMLVYLLVALNLTSSKVRGVLVAGLILLAGLNCVIAAIQFAKELNFTAFDFLPRPDYGPRASGFYGYPNHLALYLEVCLLFGLGIAFLSRWRPTIKILAGYGSIVCVAGILLTGSRGGYIGTFAGLAAFGIVSLLLAGRLVPSRALVLIAAGCLMCAGLGWGVQKFISKSMVLQARVEQKFATSDIRLQLWKAAWNQFKLQPATGTGSGTYLYYARQFRHPTIPNDPVHAHNEYLELLAEYGIFGIALALMFIDTHLRSGWKACSREGAEDADALAVGSNSLALTVGALAAAVACMAHSMVDYTLHMPANMLVMAFVFGLLANPQGRSADAADASQGESVSIRVFRWVLPALGLVIGIYALPTLPAEYYAEKASAVMNQGRYVESENDARTLESLARKGLAWDAKNPVLYSYLAAAQSSLAAQSTDPAIQKELAMAALEAHQKAKDLAPLDVYAVLGLAWALDDLGRHPEAGPLFEQAVKLGPRSAYVHHAYARYLHKIGKFAEAEVEYRKALQLGGGPSVDRGLERLAKDLKARQSGEPAAPQLR